jgi:hypothetical protein
MSENNFKTLPGRLGIPHFDLVSTIIPLSAVFDPEIAAAAEGRLRILRKSPPRIHSSAHIAHSSAHPLRNHDPICVRPAPGPRVPWLELRPAASRVVQGLQRVDAGDTSGGRESRGLLVLCATVSVGQRRYGYVD